MHELHLMQHIVRLVEDVSRKQVHGYPAIIRLHVRANSHLARHSHQELQTTFQIAAHRTAAQSAQLEVSIIPTQGYCQTCGDATERQAEMLTCPTCGSSDVLWSDTPEIILKEIEWVEECA